MDAEGSNQIQITKTEGGYPRFVTPDGKWVYFESAVHQTLWRISTDGGEESQVSEAPVSAPAFSPDGNFVAYFVRVAGNDNRSQIAVMSLERDKNLKTLNLSEEKSVPVKIAWGSDNNGLYYVTTNGAEEFDVVPTARWPRATPDG